MTHSPSPTKLQLAIAKPGQAAINSEAKLDVTLAQLRGLLTREATASARSAPTTPLSVLQASVGNSIRMVPLDEVVFIEAADKYLRVLTASHEYLLRTPLKELLPQLDAQVFWQIHRGTVVRAQAIDSVTRDDVGRLALTLRHRGEKLVVSRLYAHRFKAM